MSLIDLGWHCFCSRDIKIEDSSGMLLSVKLKAKRIANPFCLCLGRRQLKAFRAGTTNSVVKQIKSCSELTARNVAEGRNLLGDSSEYSLV